MRSSELLALQKEWYKKLKDDGFRDVEDHYTGNLKGWDSRHLNCGQEEYYRVIGLYIHQSGLVKQRHKDVLEHYIVTGNMQESVKLAKSSLSPITMRVWVMRNLSRMLEFSNTMDKIDD